MKYSATPALSSKSRLRKASAMSKHVSSRYTSGFRSMFRPPLRHSSTSLALLTVDSSMPAALATAVA